MAGRVSSDPVGFPVKPQALGDLYREESVGIRPAVRLACNRSGVALICAAILWGPGGGCSSVKVEPLSPVPPVPPGYVRVPHPEGLDVGDLLAIFTEPEAPAPGELRTCDAEFKKLRSLTVSRAEHAQGARELVRAEPVKYHWCFYAQLANMERAIDETSYLDARQKTVLETYLFVAPIARAFLLEYNDSRYLRWAVSRYRRASEFVFYRRVELGARATSELTAAANPFGLERGRGETANGVLEKYGLVKPAPPLPSVAPSPTPVATYPDPAARAPATESTAPQHPVGTFPAAEPPPPTAPAASAGPSVPSDGKVEAVFSGDNVSVSQ